MNKAVKEYVRRVTAVFQVEVIMDIMEAVALLKGSALYSWGSTPGFGQGCRENEVCNGPCWGTFLRADDGGTTQQPLSLWAQSTEQNLVCKPRSLYNLAASIIAVCEFYTMKLQKRSAALGLPGRYRQTSELSPWASVNILSLRGERVNEPWKGVWSIQHIKIVYTWRLL